MRASVGRRSASPGRPREDRRRQLSDDGGSAVRPAGFAALRPTRTGTSPRFFGRDRRGRSTTEDHDDHGQRTDQEVRRPDRRRRRVVHPGARHGDRLPRPERRRQDDDDADDHRPGRRRRPARRVVDGRPVRASCPTRAPSSARCSTPPPCTRAGPAGPTCGCWPRRSASRRRGSTRCSSWSASPTPAGRRIGGYSLGMRQRLGIAGALLADPPVLMFDEPANGLDPEGIRWMRDLLRDHAARGGTVLLSSHLLGEVEHTVDRLLVIGAGRIVADGPVASLLGADGVAVRAADAGRAGRGPARRRVRGRSPAPTARWSSPAPRRPRSAPSRPPAVTCSPSSGRCSAAWRTSSSSSPPRHEPADSHLWSPARMTCHDRLLLPAPVPSSGPPDRSVAARPGGAGDPQVPVHPVGQALARSPRACSPPPRWRSPPRPASEPLGAVAGPLGRTGHADRRWCSSPLGRAVDRGGVDPRHRADDVPARAAARPGAGRQGRSPWR